MRFYHLTHPKYETDQAQTRANPVNSVDIVWMPGIVCDACGETWAGSRRLYIPITDPALRRELSGKPLPRAEWEQLAQRVRASAGLSENFYLEPGDRLGMP